MLVPLFVAFGVVIAASQPKCVSQTSGAASSLACGPASAKCAAVKCGRTLYRSSKSLTIEGFHRARIGDCSFGSCDFVRNVPEFFEVRNGRLCYPVGVKCPNRRNPEFIAFFEDCDPDGDDEGFRALTR